MSSAGAPELLHCRVMHRRTRPRAHEFHYPVFQLEFDAAAPASLHNALLRVEGAGLFGFHSRDHGARDGGALLPWARQILACHGLSEQVSQVRLQTFPRMLGYAFNPVSFWYCLDDAGGLRAVLAEVNNTFGGRHLYVVAHPDGRPIASGERMRVDKAFHVSPFCRVEGHYEFEFRRRDDGRRSARIRYFDREGLLLDTLIAATAAPYSAAALARCSLRYPLMTLGVWWRIHWQALQLWRKRTPFYSSHPKPREMSR